jgi:hypothetical protein
MSQECRHNIKVQQSTHKRAVKKAFFGIYTKYRCYPYITGGSVINRARVSRLLTYHSLKEDEKTTLLKMLLLD